MSELNPGRSNLNRKNEEAIYMSAIIKQSLPIVEKMIQNASNQRQIALKESKFKVNLDNIKDKTKSTEQIDVRADGHHDPNTALYLDASYLNSPQLDSIVANGVENWYYFYVPSTSPKVKINYRFIQAASQSCIVALYQLQSDLTTLSVVAFGTSGENETINYIDNSSTGVYFLRVIPLVPANSNPYEFYLQLHNNYDLIGSNFSNAREFTDALSVTGKINYVCDQEYFKITLSESGSYVLASPLGSNFIIHLYDQNLNPILTLPMTNEIYRIDGFNTAVYYLTVGYYGDASSFVPIASYPLEFTKTRIPAKATFIDLSYIDPEKVNWNAGMRYLVSGFTNFIVSGRIIDSLGRGVPFEQVRVELVDEAWSPDHGNNSVLFKRRSNIVSTDGNGDFQVGMQTPVAYGLYSIYTVRLHIYDHGELYIYTANDNFNTHLATTATENTLFYILGY